MERLLEKRHRLQKRKKRVKFAIRSTHALPRMYVFRSNRYLHSQIIDDKQAKVLCCASTSEKDFPVVGKNIKSAEALGSLLATRAAEKGLKKVVFDRRGLLYHGKIAKFVNAVRENGIEV